LELLPGQDRHGAEIHNDHTLDEVLGGMLLLRRGSQIEPPKRKPMTLIAAFWCAGNQAVLCADSAECYGDYKTSVTKIQPQRLSKGLYQVAFGGSGVSDLVDGLGWQLESALDACQARTELELQQEIQKSVVQFYSSDAVKAYPCDLNDLNSYVSGVICIRVVPTETVFLFKFSKTIVLPVRDFVLRGWEGPIYDRIVKRLFRPLILPLHAQLVGLRTLSEAESTSTAVDSPFTTVFAMTHGMFTSNRSTDLYVQALANVQREMDDLLLICADTHAVPDAEARARLKAFQQTILVLRRDHQKLLDRDFKKDLRGVTPSTSRRSKREQ
jgi:hypothetical protein